LPELTGSQDDRFEYREAVAGVQALAERGRVPVRRRRRSEAASAPAVAADLANEGDRAEVRGAAGKESGNPCWREPWKWRPAGMMPGVVADSPEYQARRKDRNALARAARARGRRLATICDRFQGSGRVPDLRLSGKWLKEVGFDLGQRFEVEVEAGKLTIRAV
jgi:hypothetical protein